MKFERLGTGMVSRIRMRAFLWGLPIFAAIGAAVGWFAANQSVHPEQIIIFRDFENGVVGEWPCSFTVESGEWRIEQDGKNRVVAQQGHNDDDTFNLLLADHVSIDNVDLSVRLKAVAGGLDRGGGLVWRAKDKNNYYIARYNPLENNFRVYKVEGGKRTQFQSADTPGDTAWHTLRITMTGAKITCYLDGVKHLEVVDSTFRDPGKIGLWSKADAQTYFDDLTMSKF
jgi:Domain of Unknown Function (DUF1080)